MTMKGYYKAVIKGLSTVPLLFHLHQVADLVKKSRLTVTFHILGDEAYQEAKRNGINLAEPQSYSAQSQPTMNGVHAAGPKLKLCFLQKSKSSFGFSLKSSKGKK